MAEPSEIKTSDKTAGQKTISGIDVNNIPDFRIVQPETRENEKGEIETNFKIVGGLTKKISKAGKPYMELKIGNLRLMAFENLSNTR